MRQNSLPSNDHNSSSIQVTPTKPGGPPFTNPTNLLRYVYGDVTRLKEVSLDSIVLHPAMDGALDRIGVQQAQQHEEDLVRTMGGPGNFRMEVEGITASEEFGCVMGSLVADSPPGGERGRLAVGFCGVWRFEWKKTENDVRVDGGYHGDDKEREAIGGRTVWAAEHWENLTPEGRGEVQRWVGGGSDGRY
ncbi:hypothetical protein QBC35DRAFT_469886 [Podospora australis]|uniref:SnoaL-like domain-containing protein n=1 Tax=Podospora australis TaxID=1536484 RepID=A0AAN7AP66_9PEZI|nr:hypothetical protein QBC35DRAFT_469886 [Podospora australis]